MVTYKTLEVMVEKCKEALGVLEADHAKVTAAAEHLKERRIAVAAQIETLEMLMDVENNPPTVELPHAGDDIEELFEQRLDGPEDLSQEEVHKDRQEHAYLREAMDAAKDIDAINTEEQSSRENATLNT